MCGAGAGARVGQVPRGLPLRKEPLDDATWRESLRRVPGETQEALFGLGLSVAERVVRGGPLLPVKLDFVLTEERAAKLRCWVEAARRQLSEQHERSPAEESRLWSAERIALEYVSQRKRVPEWVGYLVVLQVCVDEWDPPQTKSERDPVAERDGWHCMAPGCTAQADLQRHHLVYRSHGGGDEDENLLMTCFAHHQLGEHGGQARCRGRAPLGVVWRLGCAALGTWWLSDRRLERRR